ncbi:hypothetical protein L210DRAFT_3539853 [Boletus edulis BED1]|uniref:Uncharacterized protein n=1 Tax=Boletus edulis BED1 TaxID=1328754 RepID=A0AAD4BVZ3_BOLED|nr:hypothetical protein L210DRAFT_3539853 [Boletus edulis BED1]
MPNTFLPPRVNAMLNELHNSPTYLGNAHLAEALEWRRVGRKDFIFPNHVDNENDEEEGRCTEEPAILSIIADISHDSFWLSSDAGWRGPTEITPSLSDVKGTCIGTAPRSPILHDHFSQALQHILVLQALVATPDITVRQGFTQFGSERLKFRHIFFETIRQDDLETTVALTNWPVHSDAARRALQCMEDDFRAIPLPAYDVNDTLIQPALYRQKLAGCLAQIEFQLSHVAFGNKDTFTADIYNIRILIPSATQSVPRKRKLPQILLTTTH